MAGGLHFIVRTYLGTIGLVVFAAFAAASPSPTSMFKIPPKAAEVTGSIGQVDLAPVFAERYFCMEHSFGELAYAGDALGTDCVVVGGLAIGVDGYLKLYRANGETNADWYGWHADVLAPFDGTVVYVFPDAQENVPGILGSSPAGTLRFENADGVIVNYGHVTEIAVKVGDTVKAGQVVGKVGNNGQSRAPHIHIGAYRDADALPLQIRWDLRAMAEARAGGGVK